ncbi:MAG: hypothetical protein ACREBG_01880 [Pyrinomonadaceae bacterium]
MQIIYNLPHVFNGSSHVEDAYALRALLDCLVRLNLAFLRNHPVQNLYRSGVIYGRTTWWEPIPALYRRKYGDCKSLSAALIAEYVINGIEAKPVFRFNPRGDAKDFHILVQTMNGFEDPSKRLGMGKNECAKFTSKTPLRY